MTSAVTISLNVNGERIEANVPPRLNLSDFLREHLKLTGTHIGCEHGVCGACTVRVDGEIVRSCLMLAVQTHDTSVETIEGLSDSGEIADLQAAFRARNALQCGFCTPGMVMSCAALVERDSNCTLEDVKSAVSGHLCRCGTYPNVFQATLAAARMVREEKGR